MKEAKLLIITLILAFSSVAAANREKPLANSGKSGLYAKSLDQVLRLREDEVDLATAALIVSENWSDMVYGRKYLAQLDDMAREIRDRLDKNRIPANYRAVPEINKYLFDELKFDALSEATDPNSLFLHTVLDKKLGYCLSLSILYLSVGERLGLDLYGVVVPGHFFVRYDDGHVRFNIETTSKGGSATDEQYIEKFKVPKDKRNNIYMKNLNKIQTIGCFLNNLGNSYSDVGNTDKALSVLKKAIEINPSLSEARANLGNIYLKKGQINNAINEYMIALNINPSDAKTHNNLGNAYSDNGRTSMAVSEYMDAISLDPNFVDAYRNLAIAYCTQERFTLAVLKLNDAVDLDPDNANIYNQLGEVYLKMGKYSESIKQYQKAINIKSDMTEPYYGLALCYNKVGKISDEIAAYQKVLSLQPDNYAAMVNLGNVYFQQGKYTDAIELYKKAVKIQNNESTIYYNLGVAYANVKDYKQASEAYLKSIEIDPKLGDAHYGLAFCFYYLKQYDKAWEHIKIAQELGVKISAEQIEVIKRKL